DAQVVQELAADALDLLRRKGRLGEAFDEDPDGLRGRLARAPPLEREELLAVVELEGRADPLEAVRELRGAHPARAAQEELGRELRDAVVGPLRRDAGGHAAPERDERIRRQGVLHEDGAVPGGGLVRSLSPSRSRTASTRSRDAPRARVTLAISNAGSSFISCLTPTSVARRASTSARYRRFERGRQSPAANGTMPRHPPRTVDRRTSAGVSSWFAAGMCHPTDRRSAGPGRQRSLRPSPCFPGSYRRRGSGC